MSSIYPLLRPYWEPVSERPGVLVAVASLDAPYELAGACWMVPNELPAAVIVGRHSQCNLQVNSLLTELSLRHLAVLSYWSDDGLWVQIHDLETAVGFGSHHGAALRSVRFSGTATFSLGRLGLGVFETGRGMPELEGLCRTLPESVYFAARSSHRRPSMVPSRADGSVTHIEDRPRSVYLKDVPATGVEVGRIRLWDGGDVREAPVTDEALERGILLGRYPRCAFSFEQNDNVSRVHMMLLKLDGRNYLVDTASTNGLCKRDREDESVAVALAPVHFADRFDFAGARLGFDPPEGTEPKPPSSRSASLSRFAPLGLSDPSALGILDLLDRNAGLMTWDSLASAYAESDQDQAGPLTEALAFLRGALGARQRSSDEPWLQVDSEARLVRLNRRALKAFLDGSSSDPE